MDALFIGGTQFVGWHAVQEFLDHDYDVTVFTRGNNPVPEGVEHVAGDRTDEDAVAALAEREPNVVVDCIAYHPGEVRHACEVFADVDAYVYVSSASAYDDDVVPLRAGEADLAECPPEAEDDDSQETYGPRKAEGDRAVFAAAERGVRAMSVRPSLVYGPDDPTERFAYWLARLDEGEPFVVPGDGGSLLHRIYVEDLASAIRLVAEEGTAGEAYDVGDRQALSLSATFDRLAEHMDVDPDPVYAGQDALEREGLSPFAFPLYTPRPILLSTEKLARLGWSPRPLEDALAGAVEAYREEGRDGSDLGPDREAERALIESLTDEE